MNYPFRTAIVNFMRGRDSGPELKNTVMSIVENYPPQVVACNMNLLGTHDTPRILTALVDDFDGSREEKAARRLTKNQMEVARDRLQMAVFLQFTLPGCPSVYYGDEALMEGYKDPFNRRTYPWGREDKEILGFFRHLGRLRRERKVCKVYVNRSGDPWEFEPGKVLLGRLLDTVVYDRLVLGPRGFCIVEV